MKISRQTRIIILCLLVLSKATESHGQYNVQNQLMVTPDNPYSQTYKGITSCKITHLNGMAYLVWTVMNDTLDGCFAVYKSKAYGSIKVVGYISYPKDLPGNIPFLFSMVDTMVEKDFDLYHIVKIDDKTVFYANEHVIFRNSVANIRLPEQDSYIEQKRLTEAKREMITQGF